MKTIIIILTMLQPFTLMNDKEFMVRVFRQNLIYKGYNKNEQEEKLYDYSKKIHCKIDLCCVCKKVTDVTYAKKPGLSHGYCHICAESLLTKGEIEEILGPLIKIRELKDLCIQNYYKERA